MPGVREPLLNPVATVSSLHHVGECGILSPDSSTMCRRRSFAVRSGRNRKGRQLHLGAAVHYLVAPLPHSPYTFSRRSTGEGVEMIVTFNIPASESVMEYRSTIDSVSSVSVRQMAVQEGSIDEWVKDKLEFEGRQFVVGEKPGMDYPVSAHEVYLDMKEGQRRAYLVLGDVYAMNDEGKTIYRYKAIPTVESSEKRMAMNKLHQLMEAAAIFYSENLHDEEGGKRAREHLLKLGIPEEIWDKRGLGYALPEWDKLMRVFGEEHIKELRELGLLVGGKRIIDRFRDRIICPLRDSEGRVIAFRGLAIEEGGVKLMDSPVHELFGDIVPVDWDGPFRIAVGSWGSSSKDWGKDPEERRIITTDMRQ